MKPVELPPEKPARPTVVQRRCEHAMVDARGYCVVCHLWRPYAEREIAQRVDTRWK